MTTYHRTFRALGVRVWRVSGDWVSGFQVTLGRARFSFGFGVGWLSKA